MRIRLTRKFCDVLNGFDLRPLSIGQVIDSTEPLAQVRNRPLFEGDHRRHCSARIPPRRLISYNRRRTRVQGTKTKAAAPFGTAARTLQELERVLVQVVRHVVERRVQLVADALHRANRRNGDESCDQAVFNGRCTLAVVHQLDEALEHFWSPVLVSRELVVPPPSQSREGWQQN